MRSNCERKENSPRDIIRKKKLETDSRKEIPFCNIAAAVGAPTMAGQQKYFIEQLKGEVSNVLDKHFNSHRQHLDVKNQNERLHTSLHYIITVAVLNGMY